MSCRDLGYSPVRSTADLRPLGLGENDSVLFQAIKVMVICFDSHHTLVCHQGN